MVEAYLRYAARGYTARDAQSKRHLANAPSQNDAPSNQDDQRNHPRKGTDHGTNCHRTGARAQQPRALLDGTRNHLPPRTREAERPRSADGEHSESRVAADEAISKINAALNPHTVSDQ